MDQLAEELCFAAGEGGLSLLTDCLAAGADPNAVESQGWPALISATFGGSTACAKALLNAGASASAAATMLHLYMLLPGVEAKLC